MGDVRPFHQRGHADESFDLIRTELNLRHLAFNHRRLREFAETMHKLSFEADSAGWWADTFTEVTGRERGCAMGRASVAGLYGPGGN